MDLFPIKLIYYIGEERRYDNSVENLIGNH
jgi:hypothetical protein